MRLHDWNASSSLFPFLLPPPGSAPWQVDLCPPVDLQRLQLSRVQWGQGGHTVVLHGVVSPCEFHVPPCELLFRNFVQSGVLRDLKYQIYESDLRCQIWCQIHAF